MERLDDNRPWGMEVDQYCMLLHLSQYASYTVPLLGIAAPVVMWSMNKDLDPKIDAHGKSVVNWVISSYIFFIILGVLSFLLIGIPFLIILGIVAFIFPIIGAIKASNGEFYKYPFSIQFVK